MTIDDVLKQQAESGDFLFHELRLAAGATQQDVAKACNVSQPAVRRWDIDPMMIKFQYLLIIAELFNISTTKMLKGVINHD